LSSPCLNTILHVATVFHRSSFSVKAFSTSCERSFGSRLSVLQGDSSRFNWMASELACDASSGYPNQRVEHFCLGVLLRVRLIFAHAMQDEGGHLLCAENSLFWGSSCPLQHVLAIRMSERPQSAHLHPEIPRSFAHSFSSTTTSHHHLHKYLLPAAATLSLNFGLLTTAFVS